MTETDKMVEHTKTPWSRDCFQVYGSDNSRVTHTGMGNLPPSRSSESEANAAFIVRACNSHDALVDALQGWLAYAEENLSEFDVPGDECTSETLCHACQSAGCIQMKIRSARAALAAAGAPQS